MHAQGLRSHEKGSTNRNGNGNGNVKRRRRGIYSLNESDVCAHRDHEISTRAKGRGRER